MTTYPTSLDSTYARSPNVALFKRIAAPSIGIREQLVDQVLVDSFPASDPPPWTLGRVAGPPPQRPGVSRDDDAAWSSHTTVIVAGGKRTAWQWMATGAGAIGISMLIPIAILAIGIPIALATLALTEVTAWLAAVVLK